MNLFRVKGVITNAWGVNHSKTHQSHPESFHFRLLQQQFLKRFEEVCAFDVSWRHNQRVDVRTWNCTIEKSKLTHFNGDYTETQDTHLLCEPPVDRNRTCIPSRRLFEPTLLACSTKQENTMYRDFQEILWNANMTKVRERICTLLIATL